MDGTLYSAHPALSNLPIHSLHSSNLCGFLSPYRAHLFVLLQREQERLEESLAQQREAEREMLERRQREHEERLEKRAAERRLKEEEEEEERKQRREVEEKEREGEVAATIAPHETPNPEQ